MGLSLSFGISLKGIGEKYKDRNDWYVEEDLIDIEYDLNWSAVRFEKTYLLKKFIFENIELDTEIITDQLYMELSDNFDMRIVNGSEVNKNNKFILNSKVEEFFKDESVEKPLSALNLLSMGLWNGFNGEYFEIRKQKPLKRKILMIIDKKGLKKLKIDNEKEYVAKVNDEQKIVKPLVLQKKFINLYKNSLNNTMRVAENDSTYMGRKSKDIIEVLKIFLEEEEACFYACFG